MRISSGPRRNGLIRAASDTRFQKASSAARAPAGPPCVSPCGHHGGVHGAGRRAGNAVELQPRLLQQPVEHAPGEGAVRAAALQARSTGTAACARSARVAFGLRAARRVAWPVARTGAGIEQLASAIWSAGDLPATRGCRRQYRFGAALASRAPCPPRGRRRPDRQQDQADMLMRFPPELAPERSQSRMMPRERADVACRFSEPPWRTDPGAATQARIRPSACPAHKPDNQDRQRQRDAGRKERHRGRLEVLET